MPDPSPSTLTVLNFNFLQLGRRSSGRSQRTVYPRRLPVNCETHCVSGDRTHKPTPVSATRKKHKALTTLPFLGADVDASSDYHIFYIILFFSYKQAVTTNYYLLICFSAMRAVFFHCK